MDQVSQALSGEASRPVHLVVFALLSSLPSVDNMPTIGILHALKRVERGGSWANVPAQCPEEANSRSRWSVEWELQGDVDGR